MKLNMHRDAPIDRPVTGIGWFSRERPRPAIKSDICRFHAGQIHSGAAWLTSRKISTPPLNQLFLKCYKVVIIQSRLTTDLRRANGLSLSSEAEQLGHETALTRVPWNRTATVYRKIAFTLTLINLLFIRPQMRQEANVS